MVQTKLSRLLQSEAPEFRGAPFWAWNGELKESELRRQIQDMHQMGFGGFFMHSRVGLRTPYLSKAWFDAVKICIDEAGKNNMKAWIFDEDRWPSGTCGGQVTRDWKYALQGLNYSLSKRIQAADENTVGRFAAMCRDGEVVSCRLLEDDDCLRDHEKYLHIFRVFDDTFTTDNNQAPMVDTMNPDAIRLFLELTHERYAQEVGEEFGKLVPGIFTDEPRYFIFCRAQTPWTTLLPEKFQAKYGYDLLPCLPELFFLIDGSDVSKVRLDFYNLASELFCTAFARQVGEWCEAHHLMLTGHALGEEDLLSQYNCIGSAMRFYEHQQQPGIDILTEHWNALDAPIQCSSVARQMGRKHCLSEMYAGLNWETRFETIKAVAEWQTVLGIDSRCPHLALYSMEGEAKRDFPPSFLSQSPWYREHKLIEDHFAAIHTVWSFGKALRETLVIHPLESIFFYKPLCRMKKEVSVNQGGAFIYTGREKLHEQERMIGIRNLLLGQHIAFDYGDEDMISRMGGVTENLFRVGEVSYRQAVIPELRTIRRTTLELLNQFAAGGAPVWYLGEIPEYVDGVRSDFARRSYAKFRKINPEHPEELRKTLPPPLSIHKRKSGKEVGELLADIHEGDELSSLFIVNFSTALPRRNHKQAAVWMRKRTFPQVEVAWRVAAGRHVFEFDMDSGAIRPVDGKEEQGNFCFTTGFDRLQSRLFLAAAEDLSNAPAASASVAAGTPAVLPERCRVSLSNENSLLLDRPQWRIGTEKWQPATNVLMIDHRICQLQKRPERDGGMLQPWYAATLPQPKIIPLPVSLRYHFTLRDELQGLTLGIEHPERYTLRLNGNEFCVKDLGWLIDPAIRRIALPETELRSGENILELTVLYDQTFPGLEALYLRGDFSVAGDDSLGKAVDSLTWGDWCKQGLKYYAGHVSYHIPVNGGERGGRAKITIPEWEGALLGIRVGNGEEKRLGWPPFATEMEFLPGENPLTITVYASLRNLFGPFYMKKGFDEYGRDHFGRYPEMASRWYWHVERETPALMPCGLLTAPCISLETK